METSTNELTKVSHVDSYKKPKSRVGSPFKARVTFQLGAEDDEVSTDSYDDKYDFRLSEMKGRDRFKKGVSKIMQEKNVDDELTKNSSKDDDDDINKDLASVTKYLLKKSSIYAVSQVGHAESPHRKILWVIVLAAGLFGCGYEIYRFLTLYFQYPVVVNLHVENERTLEFPAVTICNLNRMRKKFEICLDSNVLTTNCSVFQGNGIPTDATSERIAISACSDELNFKLNSNFKNKFTFLAKYSELDSSSRQRFGHQFNDLIRSCSFNGETCSLEYFAYFQSLKYGNCYSFNRFSVEDDTVIKTSITGIMSGLELTLNFDPDNYLPTTSSIGARVLIHDPRDDPNTEEDGVNISPGFETILAMKQRGVSRLPSPYKDHCVNYEENKEIEGNNRNECVKLCMQKENYARCSCIDPALTPFKQFRVCNLSDINETCCLNSALKSMSINGLPCKCPLPCTSTTYDVRLSTAIWPSESNYFDSFCKECSIEKQSAKADKHFFQALRQKEARLKIYYSTLERPVYEQKAMFQDSELYSHLGGQLGLWLGLSIVAAFELIENMIYICKYCATLLCTSGNK